MVMLVVVYTFNFIDRQLLGILAVPIKAELALTDTQLGLLGGIAFALFYTGLAIPAAMVADRHSRTWVITWALALWSAMTALCGFAQNFWQLFLGRLGVGVGEAGGVAPAYSLIADYFPPQQRARAISLYSFGIPIGTALGIIGGGYIAAKVDWRYAFVVIGVAGLLLAPVFRLTVREPQRGRLDATGGNDLQPVAAVLRNVASKKSFWLASLGAASASMLGYAAFFWLPSFFVRSFGLSLTDAAMTYGSIVLVGGLAGIWLGGWAGDRFGARQRPAYLIVPAVAFVVAVPCYLLALATPNLTLAFVALLLPTALGLAWLGPVLSVVQHVVPPEQRATASAIFLFVINLFGLGLGTLVVGVLSDQLTARFGDDALRYSIMAGTVFYLVAAGLLLLAARCVSEDWERAAP